MKKSFASWLNYFYMILILLGMSFILTAAMVMQYVYHELPCPLCLLQRWAYFGIAFGAALTLRNGYSLRYFGITLLSTVYLLVVSIRQSVLDIVPRPLHHWIGSAIFGIHMPVWSIIIALFLLIVYAVKYTVMGDSDILHQTRLTCYPVLRVLSTLLILFLTLLLAINFVSIILQCGIFHICHTFFYRLLPHTATVPTT